MRVSLVLLIALFGCVSISTGSAIAEIHGQQHFVIIKSFNQSAPDAEPTEDEPVEEGCDSLCYPPPG